MAKHQLPKLRLWVRFPSPAPRRNGLFSVPIFIDRLFTIYALQGGAFSLCCRFFFKTRSAMPIKINFCFFAKKGLTSCKRRGILIKSLRESSALINPEGFPSGQRGQTVNLLRFASMVRIHLPPPKQLKPPFLRRFFVLSPNNPRIFLVFSFYFPHNLHSIVMVLRSLSSRFSPLTISFLNFAFV